jgi:hypothetical protein
MLVTTVISTAIRSRMIVRSNEPVNHFLDRQALLYISNRLFREVKLIIQYLLNWQRLGKPVYLYCR